MNNYNNTLVHIENTLALQEQDAAQFKVLNRYLKSMVADTHSQAVNFDEILEAKKKKANLSRGWVRPSGVKVPPSRLLLDNAMSNSTNR